MSVNQLKATKVITGKVRLSYAHIWQPTAIDEGQEKKYSASLIIPKADTKTIDKINGAVEAAMQSGAPKWGGKIPAALKLPLRDGDLERPEDENYRNSYFINANSKTRPGIVDVSCEPIFDQEEVYSGCYVIASVTFYPFNVSGNKGIAAGLNNIMKVADGEPLGGRQSAEADFAGVVIEDDDEIAALIG